MSSRHAQDGWSKVAHLARHWAPMVIVVPGLLPLTRLAADFGRPRQAASGEFSAGGIPATGADVCVFRRLGTGQWESVGSARTDQAGRFHLRLHGLMPGLPVGDYAATAEWRPPVSDGDSIVRGPNRLDARYADPGTSPLSLRVTSRGASALAWDVPLCPCAGHP